jgi:Tol biopolymer transport system component
MHRNTKWETQKISLVVTVLGLVLLSLIVGWESTTDVAASPGRTADAVARIGQGNDDVVAISLSADGDILVFSSNSTNLVVGDTNATTDIFAYSKSTGQINLVSVALNGESADGPSGSPAIAGEGRYLAFASEATNLVLGDTNNHRDIFVRDLINGQTSLVSVSSAGEQANGDSFHPAISADGRYIVFESDASNLVDGDTNGYRDIFLHDRILGITRRISVASGGDQADRDSFRASISADGGVIAFESSATNLVADDTNGMTDVFVWDMTNQQAVRISVNPATSAEANGPSNLPVLAAEGRYVAFRSFADNLVAGDVNDSWDIFVYDLATDTVELASVNSMGDQAVPALFYPGVSVAGPSISAAGRYVVFQSDAKDLVSGDLNQHTDVFLRDLQSKTTERISVTWNGGEANSDSYWPRISANGQFIAFLSKATNLVIADQNGAADVFLFDRQSPFPTPTPTHTPSATVTPTITPTPTPRSRISLPLVMHYRPVAVPVLADIDNSDQDNSYLLSWKITDTPASNDVYVLEEASQSDFSDSQIVYQGPDKSWAAAGRTPGTYFYRVKRRSGATETAWSGVQSVIVRPLFVGLNVHWEGYEYVRGSDNTDVGYFWEESATQLADGMIRSDGRQWYNPNPYGWPVETWSSYYNGETGVFVSSTLEPDPGLKWGSPWILPYALSLDGVSTVLIAGQKFSVTGPFAGDLAGGYSLQYWRLSNQDSFVIWDNGGSIKQIVRPGEIELWYDAGATGLLLHQNIVRRDYRGDTPTGDTYRYVLDLTNTNALVR